MENIRFASKEHEEFYTDILAAIGNRDTFHKAFFYAMGISMETRNHIRFLFDFKRDCIKPEGISLAWQTGSSRRLCRLAFNLWNGWAEEGRENRSTPYELFDCGYAPYFFEAIRLLYPEYCWSPERTAPHLSRTER